MTGPKDSGFFMSFLNLMSALSVNQLDFSKTHGNYNS